MQIASTIHSKGSFGTEADRDFLRRSFKSAEGWYVPFGDMINAELKRLNKDVATQLRVAHNMTISQDIDLLRGATTTDISNESITLHRGPATNAPDLDKVSLERRK
jgi:hypothetical protein